MPCSFSSCRRLSGSEADASARGDHGLRPGRLNPRAQPRAPRALGGRDRRQRRRVPPPRRRVHRPHGHRHRLRPRRARGRRHRAGRRLRRGLQRRQLQHHLGPAGAGDVRVSNGSSPASTTRSAPRSTSGSASRPWRPCAGPPTGCCATSSRRARSRSGATRPVDGLHRRGAAAPRTGSAARSGRWRSATGARVAYLMRFGIGHAAHPVDRAAGRRPGLHAGHRRHGRPVLRRSPVRRPKEGTDHADRHRRGRQRRPVDRPGADRQRPPGHAHRAPAAAAAPGAGPGGRVGARRRLRAGQPRRRPTWPAATWWSRPPATTRSTWWCRCWPRPSSRSPGWSPGSTAPRTSGCSPSSGASTWRSASRA